MKKLLMTTALLTALAGGVSAQQATDGMIVPEGYSAFADFSVLTFESLEGAAIYDVNGDSIGSISDIVLDMQAASGAMTDGAADMASDTEMVTATETEMNADATAEMATDPAATDPAATDSAATDAGVTETDPMVDGVDTATGTQSTDPVETEGLDQGEAVTAETMDPNVETDTVVTDVDTDMNTDVDNMAEDATLDIAETASDAIEDINDTADQATDEMADGTDGVTGMVDATADESGQQVSMAGGGISHVIIDIGGFLGIGVHTVALPIEALEIYADANDDLRIYVPWSEDQLRNLQQYDANNPDTLGRMPDAG